MNEQLEEVKKVKKVAKAKPIVKDSLASSYLNPNLYNVATKIVVDDMEFLPRYQTAGSACVDLKAYIKDKISLPHRCTVVVDCGFSMQIPPGYKACVSARSGLASRGLIVTNAPGQIDSDYRGRVKVVVTNVGQEIIVIEHGFRIAQMWIEPVYTFDWKTVESLDATVRNDGGFGSTGMK